MDDALAKKLQFDEIRNHLAECCACTLGKALARRIGPAKRAETVRRWFDHVRQMQQAKDAVGLPPLGGVTDIRPLVRDAGTPAGLDGHDLRRVCETLMGASNVYLWAAALSDELPLIKALAARVSDFTTLAGQIDRIVDERGKVRDDASPRLGQLRRSIQSAKADIDRVFDRLTREPRITRFLQYPGATFHEDRRVLPVKAEQRGQIRGIIHRSSDTGATLFIEPAEAVALNNAVISLKDDESKEIARLLSQLSYVVHRNHEAIEASLEALAVIDLTTAKVRYAVSRRAICPDIAENGVLKLHAARHPLLLELARKSGDEQAASVVPINVRLGDDFDLLVVTGPNTGGKTVALKTVGLLALMAQSGMPIPVDPGSCVPVYRRVFIDVGDEQSIEQSLSTFSSHLSKILNVLQHAGEHSLVLLDELGSGTDPDEGAAIGRAVIDELLRLKCRAIVTTHLSQLKSIGFTHDRVDNASVEFDVESLRPMYRLRIGEPGNSNAITIARRLGMPNRLIQAARKFLGRKDRALQKAIAGTLDSRRAAERARLEANQALLDSEQQRIHYEAELRRLHQERAAHLEWSKWLNTLSAGDEVFVRKFDCRARVVRVQFQKQTVVVSRGPMELEVHLSEVSQAELTNSES